MMMSFEDIARRSRDVLVQRLIDSGHWPYDDEYRVFMKQQEVVGNRIKAELLRRLFDADDFQYLESDQAFGLPKARFYKRLPRVLAFGYELGCGLAKLLGAEPHRCHQIAKVCSLFNFGISVFDLIVDRNTDLVPVLAKHFDGTTLLRLCADAAAADELLTAAKRVTPAELRILLKVIAWFFDEVYRQHASSKQDEVFRTLSGLLDQAYRAQMASVHDVGMAQMTVSRAKSTLPFIIMGQLACLYAVPTDSDVLSAAHRVAAEIGDLFWEIDDLVDLAEDCRAGNANSILAGIEYAGNRHKTQVQIDRVRLMLADGPGIDDAVRSVANRLASLDCLLGSEHFERASAARLRQAILSYCRVWTS
jgi:hypothetical protein